MKIKKKILLVSVSVGSGHIRAAEAVKKTAMRRYPDMIVEHIDLLDYIPKPIKKLFFDWYGFAAKFTPDLYGFLYRTSDHPGIKTLTKRGTELLSKINAKTFLRRVIAFNPDYILCTFFIPADIITAARKIYPIRAPIATLITDYDIHAFWFTSKDQTYFVATEKMKNALTERGVAPPRIIVSGIPVDPVFFERKSQDVLRARYGIDQNARMLLVLAGGKGLMKSERVVQALFDIPEPSTIVAIAGKNKALEETLRSLAVPARHTLESIGWTDHIDEYMRMANVIITKSGGMSATECMTLQKPCIIINPIPGQEEANALYMTEKKYGVVAHDPKHLSSLVRSLYDDQKKMYPEVPPPNGAAHILDYIKKELA